MTLAASGDSGVDGADGDSRTIIDDDYDGATIKDRATMGMVRVGTHNVLVVDDDDMIREVAKVALESVAGWQVTTAHNGEEARRLASQQHLDLVLLDVMMPALDGPSTAALLRADSMTRELPVIFLTAKTSMTAEQLDRPNLLGVISKPFDPMSLADQIKRIAGWTGE
ncbi:MAG: response regulator [Microlunatus sp.]